MFRDTGYACIILNVYYKIWSACWTEMLDLFCLLLMYVYIRHVNGYIASYAAHLNFKNAPGTKILIINLTRDKTCDFTFAPVCLVYRTVNSFIWRSVWLSATGSRFNSKLTPDFLPYVTFNWKKTFFFVYIFLRIIKLVITLLSICFQIKI